MKSLSIVLNIILLIAVIVLFYFHFSGKSSIGSPAASKSIDKTALKVAFVNSDSLLKNYTLFNQMNKTLEDKRERFDKSFSAKEKGLQNEIAAYQKSAPRMTQGEMQAREENLMMKRQSLVQEQERLTQELMQDQSKLNDSLYNKITSFLNVYSKEKNYDLVLSHQRGGAILYGGDSLDITDDVVKGLNEQHDKSKK